MFLSDCIRESRTIWEELSRDALSGSFKLSRFRMNKSAFSLFSVISGHCSTAPWPLPQAQIKLGYPRLNCLLRNHLGVIPVWSWPHTERHSVSLTKTFTWSGLHTGGIQVTTMRIVYCVWRSRTTGLIWMARYNEISSLKVAPLGTPTNSEFWQDFTSMIKIFKF